MVNGDVAGYVKTHNNIGMLLVMNSGHLVPYNVPIPALDLINRLTCNLPYGDIILPKIEVSDDEEPKLEIIGSGFRLASLEYTGSCFTGTVLVAISCFAICAFVGSRWKSSSSSSSSSYDKIP